MLLLQPSDESCVDVVCSSERSLSMKAGGASWDPGRSMSSRGEGRSSSLGRLGGGVPSDVGARSDAAVLSDAGRLSDTRVGRFSMLAPPLGVTPAKPMSIRVSSRDLASQDLPDVLKNDAVGLEINE